MHGSGILGLWDVLRKAELGPPLSGHPGLVISLVFSPDYRFLATAGEDGKIILWDVPTHQPIGGAFTGVGAEIQGLAFRPHHSELAVLGNTKRLVWLEQSFNSLVDSDPYVGPSYEMLNVGSINVVPASPGLLSMQPRETCMIELPLFRGSFGSDSLLWRYENALIERFNARPHWGQRNFLTGSHQMLERLYGPANVAAWIEVFQWFNPTGQFSSRFTDRVGFSSHAPSA